MSPVDLPFKKSIKPILRVASLGHALLAFVNGEYIGNILAIRTYRERGRGEKERTNSPSSKCYVYGREHACFAQLSALLTEQVDNISGTAHGSHVEKSFVFQKGINLKPGTNHITFLAMTIGLPVSKLRNSSRQTETITGTPQSQPGKSDESSMFIFCRTAEPIWSTVLRVLVS